MIKSHTEETPRIIQGIYSQKKDENEYLHYIYITSDFSIQNILFQK